jgi:4-amino-4-deoxy-L-arabinose transferase-like glycosyltransferase
MKRSPLRLLLSRETALLCLALGLAFALRLGWMLAVDPQPSEFRVGDPYFYDLLGRSLAAGKGYLNMWGAPTAQWPPGYPLVLAAIFKLFGHSIALAKLLNVALGTATCLLAYLIGRRVFNGAVGLTAAFALAVFPSQVFWPTLLLSETLATFLVALIAYIVLSTLRSRSWKKAVVLGALVGFTSLVRGETVLLAVPLVIVWAIAHRSLRTGLRYGGLTLLATGVVILPWVVRNWVVMDYPILISTGSAENLIGGHWPGADGLGSFVPIIEVTDMYKGLPTDQAETLSYKEETRRALDFALHNPGKELPLVEKKLRAFYGTDDRPVLWTQKGTLNDPAFSDSTAHRLEALANLYYRIVFVIAAVGLPLWFSLRNPRKLLLVLLLLYYSFFFGFVFVGEPRLHSALIPFFSILAAASLIGVPRGLYRFAAQSRAKARGAGTAGRRGVVS